MKIAIPIDVLRPERGGLERYVTELAGALAGRGHEVHIPCIRGSLPHRNVRIHTLRCPRGPRAVGRFAAACPGWLREARVDVSLGVGRSLGADIYQAHGGLHLTSRRALERAGARRILPFSRRKDRYLRELERKQILHRGTRIVLALSEVSRRDILDSYPEVRDRIRVMPIGVDLERFAGGEPERCREEVRRRWGIPGGRQVALFVGHHFHLKGLGPALEALARLPRAAAPHLVVIGRGRPHPFRRQASRLGVESWVTFAGELGSVERVLLGADLLVQPTFHDPCSHVTLEAWAAGVPVVTTRSNGASELARGSPAAVIVEDPGDENAVARGIAEALQKDRWEGRSAAARDLARSRSLGRHVAEMEDLFQEVAAMEVREGATAP